MADERKDIFIETVEALFKIMKNYDGGTIDIFIPDEAIDFFEDYKKGKSGGRKEITDKGINILNALKEINDWITAKALGEQLDISGRSVSGTMRKLVEDGFVEKRAGNPAAYKITDKGINFQPEIAEN